MLNLHPKIVDYHAYSTSVIIPLTHNFDELMDNKYVIKKKRTLFMRKTLPEWCSQDQWKSVIP